MRLHDTTANDQNPWWPRRGPGRIKSADTTAKLEDCSGCTDPRSEGTHQGHTKQHPCPPGGDPNCGYCFPNTTAKGCCEKCVEHERVTTNFPHPIRSHCVNPSCPCHTPTKGYKYTPRKEERAPTTPSFESKVKEILASTFKKGDAFAYVDDEDWSSVVLDGRFDLEQLEANLLQAIREAREEGMKDEQRRCALNFLEGKKAGRAEIAEKIDSWAQNQLNLGFIHATDGMVLISAVRSFIRSLTDHNNTEV